MKILHTDGFTDNEQRFYKGLAYKNTIEAMQVFCRAAIQLNVALSSAENIVYSEELLLLDIDGKYNFEAKAALTALWADKGIQECISRANEFNLQDSAPYFLNPAQVERVFSLDYTATQQDILRCLLATTGIIQTDFIIDKLKFKMFDVGGQRGERKKWIHCFDNVTAIMFIGSLSEYDQVLAEDRTRNRLSESLELFEGIINLPWFKEVPIILFLNKNDLFQKKIKLVDIAIYHPAYTGGCDEVAGLKYIQDNYYDRNKNLHKCIYTHVTDATNTENIAFVWKSSKHIILEQNLTRSGLLMC